jgi:hypothetical protein
MCLLNTVSSETDGDISIPEGRKKKEERSHQNPLSHNKSTHSYCRTQRVIAILFVMMKN